MSIFTKKEKPAEENKRYAPRWTVHANCVCQTNKGLTSYEGHVIDVSCAGACFSTDRQLAINENVNLTLFLPDRGAVHVFGTAVWSKAVNSHHEIGIHFFNTSSEAQENILQHAVHANKQQMKDHLFGGWGE